jgi:phage tail-like protein
MPNKTLPFTAFNFEVQLTIVGAKALGLSDPLCSGEFAECEGFEKTMEPKTIREGGYNTTQIHLVGPVSYGNLTLKRGMTSTIDLWTWFDLATGNTTKRGLLAHGVVLMLDGRRHKVLRFDLADCIPIKVKAAALNAKDGMVAIEEIQLAYASFTVSRDSGPIDKNQRSRARGQGSG